MSNVLTVLDGAMGSELTRLGVDTTSGLWSARAIVDAPELVAAVHRSHVEAGATVHRTNTFRTRRRQAGTAWATLTARAVAIAHDVVPFGQRIAGSLAPCEDCYRPDLTPDDATAQGEHEELAWLLADEGVDLLFAETFSSAREARVATRACLATGLTTWVALTAGPDADLMTPEELAAAAAACAELGAERVFVNCVAAERTLPYVLALAKVGLAFGVYANGATWEGARISADEYLAHARAWREAGASVIGACCGTTPEHVRAVAGLAKA